MAKKTREEAVEFDILSEYWDDHDGFDIEKSMKKKLAAAYGYIRTSNTVDQNSFYHIECFNTAADAETYDEDPVANAALRLNDMVIPISTVQGDSYATYLYTNAPQNANIVVAEPSLEVGFRFHAVRISSGERLNMGTKGTLTIQRSLDDGRTWTTVATLEGAINSTDYSNTTAYTTIDLGGYLQKGSRQLIRVRGSFTYTDDSDVERTGYSTWAIVGNSVTYTELSLECLQGWNNALQASVIRPVGFPVSYLVNGAVQKTLHIQIEGTSGTLEVSYSLDSTQNGVTFSRDIPDAANTYKIFNHGVHAVTAWMTCSDGMGGTLTSNVLTNRFMVIDPDTAGDTLMTPRLLLQDVATRIQSYVQTKICDYAVFVPESDGEGGVIAGSTPVDITFYLTSYSATFPNDPNVTEYYAYEVSAAPGVKNTLTTGVEVESDSDGDIQTYFRVWRNDGGTMKNFMQESINLTNINIVVDNSDSFAPTLGASFVLNPKVRNNTEANPARILNVQNGNSEIESTWEGFDFVNDGWVTAEDGVKVLRVRAGQRLNFRFNPFAQFVTAPDSAMTLDIDCKMRNVTNEDDAIISILEQIGVNYRGLLIRPMEGNIYTKSNVIDSETNFRFCEERRTHISLNIHNAVVPNVNGDGLYDPSMYNPASSVALVRVLINGNIEREMKFNISAHDEFCTAAMSNGGITIGQDGADIDIYSIRCYSNRQLTAQDIVKNWIASLPTAEEKLAARAANDIMTGGHVDAEKVKALGKRVLILHGSEPYFYNTSVASCWWEIFQYDDNKELIKELSGTICRETGMKPKRQGSTANTYYYSNIQTKIDDAGSITIPVSSIHSSITVSDPYVKDGDTVVDIYGGNLGKNDPVDNTPKQYAYDNGMVTVPDGWIDGNGKYRGKGYMVAEGTPLAIKLVLKVNYASSMQSHLCGGTRLYNDLHTAVVGRNSLQQAVQSARVAKYTEPVFFFTQDGDNAPVFRGGGNFGAGKMDKPTWGYVKSLHPQFLMLEGSDNNYPLTDFRVPFISDTDCSEYVSYDAGEEGYFYNGLQCLDFDAGKTDNNDVPVTALRESIEGWANFIYMHSTMLRYYVGTFAQFLASDEAANTNFKYWCTDGADAMKLKRFNFVDGTWVDAGLWDSTNKQFNVVNLTTHEFTAAAYTASPHKNDYEVLNKELIAAIAAHAKKYIGWYFNVDSLKFHYAFQNHFMAGTDNCSKNTYYVIDPVAKSVTIDGVTKQCYLFELHQDDVDTISLTDNNGRSTKPYYIDRMHPYDDKDPQHTTSCYEGMYNALFNLVEEMYEETRELQSMLNAIFTAMVGLVNSADNAKGYTNSIWGCLQKYLFSIQRYYPAMAYNEQARIRYEWPALLGFVSQGAGARSIQPITQSMGSQLEAEEQFMTRRVIYMASYAAWGNFHDAGKTYNIGIADASDAFSLQAFHLPNEATSNNRYAFNVKPHQYIYPTGMLGQTAVDPHVRVAPGESYLLDLGNTESNDTGLSILGINYYRSVGNVGDISVSPNVTFEVKGKRLVEFIAEPTVTYVDSGTGKTTGAFRPNQLNISAVQVKKFSMKGSGISGSLNLNHLTRLSEIDVRGTYIYDIELPKTDNVRIIRLPETLTMLRIETAHAGAIEELTIDGVTNLISVRLTNLGNFGRVVAERCYTDGAPLTELVLTNISWQSVSRDLLMWLAGLPACTLSGSIAMLSAARLSLNDVLYLYGKYGNIQSQQNTLYIDYTKVVIDVIGITGQKYFGALGATQFGVTASGNNVKFVNNKPALEWKFVKEVDNAEVTDNDAYEFIRFTDSVTGAAEVIRLNTAGDETRFKLKVTATLENNDTVSATWLVGAFLRIPHRGDFAFADGTFDDEPRLNKTNVGFVVRVTSKESAGVVTGYTVDVCSWKNPTIRSNDNVISGSAHAWGPYPSNDNNGMPQAFINEVAAASDAVLTNTAALGGGNADFASLEKAKVLTDTAKKVINGYLADMWSDTDLTQYAESASSAQMELMQRVKALAEAHQLPRTNVELGDMMEALQVKMGLDGAASPARYRQLFFPAAYCAHLYEPTVADGETLHEAYRRTKWVLPASGMIYLIWQMYHASRNKVNNGTVSQAYANEDNTVANADYPLFANLVKRLIDAGMSTSDLAMLGNGNWWTCCEGGATGAWYLLASGGGLGSGNGKYGQSDCRAVAAFTYNL